MVAIVGSGWKLAPCLVAMFDEADRRWPNRSRISDGSIGDAAHSTRKSDHNPSASGFVCAGDLTDDKANGCDADLFAEHLRVSRDPRVKYAICNGRIFKGGTWVWVPYTGVNAHEKHTHVSVWDTPEARNDKRLWFPYADAPDPAVPEEDDDMPLPKVTYVKTAGDPTIYVASTDPRAAPRAVSQFRDLDYHLARFGGVELVKPTELGYPLASCDELADATGDRRQVLIVGDGSLFGL